MNIAFIGLGNMGLPMALNLLKAGHRVRGFDLAAEPLQRLVDAGGQPAFSVAAAVADCELVITMLPASKHVERVYLDDDGIVANGRPGTLLLDCSTIDPGVAISVAEQAAARGFALLDAPVSGGVGGAQAGTLTFMVGGDAAGLELARPVLSAMGKNIYHAGARGTGQTVKVCNNMLLGIQMLGTCEALRLDVRNGMDPAVLSQVMAKSSGRNWVLEVYNPCPGVMEGSPASRGYRGGFAVDLMLKDLRLATACADASDADVPMAALAGQLYEALSRAGHGCLDFSSAYEKLASR